MGNNKGKTPQRSSARLFAKRNNQATKSEAKQKRCANDPQKQQEVEAQQNIAALNKADFPPAAASAQFSTGYSSPLNIPPQFPLNQVGHTVSSSNPGVAMYNNRPPNETLNLSDMKPPQSLMHQSFVNRVGLDQMMPPNLYATGNQFHTGETQGLHDQFRMVNSEPGHPSQFQTQQNHFQTYGGGLQGGPRHAENKFSNWIVGQEVSMQHPMHAGNLSNCNPVQRSHSNHIDQVENLINENTLLEEPPQKGKSGIRVQLDKDDKQRLYELSKHLKFRSLGAAMDWLSPYETKCLFELTERMGYEKGGQTIDWLLSMTPNRISRLTEDLGYQNGGQTVDWCLPEETNRLNEVTRELGFTKIGQTIECLLEMATYRPLLELNNLLGFQDCRKTIEWLLNEAQQNNAAMIKSDLPPAAPSPLPSAQFATGYSSPLNISPQFPLNRVGDTVSSSNPIVAMYNDGPPTPTLNLGQEVSMQQSSQDRNNTVQGSNSSHTDQYVDVNSHIQMPYPAQGLNQGHPNIYDMIMRRRMEDGYLGKVLPKVGGNTSNSVDRGLRAQVFRGMPTEVSMQQSSKDRNNTVQGSNSSHTDQYVDVNSHIHMTYPAQGLNQGHPNMYDVIMQRRMEDGNLGNQLQPQFATEVGGNPSNSVDLGLRAQVFPGSPTHVAGMATGIQMQNNIIAKDGVEAGTINTHFAM
jgi:hypothetical protein